MERFELNDYIGFVVVVVFSFRKKGKKKGVMMKYFGNFESYCV